MTPVPLTAAALHAALLDMAAAVLAGDSFGGSISYDAMDEDLPDGADFMVQAAYRVGNSQGQGGMRILGNPS